MTSKFFADQIEDQREAWKTAHDEAMECRDLEDRIRIGIGLFHVIRLSDDSWSRKVQAKSTPFSPDEARNLNEAYHWWLGPCEEVLEAIQLAERDYKVEGVGEFLRCYRLARNIASIDVTGLIESVAQLERGEVAEMSEEDWGGLPDSANT